MNSIREAKESDWNSIWRMFRSVVDQGGEFLHESIEPEDAFHIWFAAKANAYVVDDQGKIVGAYYLKPNAPGRGGHVANATYMVDETRRGCGIGRAMGLHSIDQASALGYSAIQFNAVVATNAAAIQLWKSLGFQVMGRIPQAYRHKTHGEVDVLIMHRQCGEKMPENCNASQQGGLLDRLLHHDVWTTNHFLEHCRGLDESKWDAQHDIGHGSIRATFHHIIHNMEIWSLLMANEPIVHSRDQSFDALKVRLQAAADRFKQVARQVASDQAWEKTWVDHLDDPPQHKSYGTTIAHLITHSMHHRAQLLHMMRKSGMSELPEGDVFTAEQAQA